MSMSHSKSLLMALVPALLALSASSAAGLADEPKETAAAAASAPTQQAGERKLLAEVLGQPIYADEVEPDKEFDAQQQLLREQGREHLLMTAEAFRHQALARRIGEVLLEQFAAEHKVEPTDEEIDQFLRRLQVFNERTEAGPKEPLVEVRQRITQIERAIQSGKLNEEQLADAQAALKTYRRTLANMEEIMADPKLRDEQDRFFAQWYVRNWKMQKALYRQYGGRVMLQQIGPQAADATRRFFEERFSRGDLAIHDDQAREAFWDQFDKVPGEVAEDPNFVFSSPWALMHVDDKELAEQQQ